MAKALPGSLSEGAAERSEAEGVSSDGSTMPTIYTPAHINSEIFEQLRSSKYTPSVSYADSSLREGAWMRAVPFIRPLRNRKVSGDFHRPYETLMILVFTIQRSTLPQSRPLGVPAPSGREPGLGCAIHPTTQKSEGCGRFSSPLRKAQSFLHFTIRYYSTKNPHFPHGWAENGGIF